MNNEIDRKKYYLKYSIMFFLLIVVMSIPFIINGTTLVGKNDSVIQHYPFLFKIRDFYLYNIKALFTGHELKQIDYNTFLGLDIIQTYNYYGYGNPLLLLLILFKEKYLLVAYHMIVISALYLGGLVFSEYCFYHKKKSEYVLFACLIYLLSPMVISNIHQLCFVYLIYQIPLVAWGFDKIFNENKIKLFTVSICLMALSGFYFLYMITVALMLYGIYLTYVRTKNTNAFWKYGIEKLKLVVVGYIIGIALAAPIFIPTVYGFIKSFRGGITSKVPIFYSFKDYIMQIPSFLIYVEEKGFMLNVGLLIIVILLFRMNSNNNHKKIIIGLIVMSQLAIVGFVFNGFSYETNRWFILTYFYFAYISILVFEKIKKKSIYIIIALTFIQPFIFLGDYAAKSCDADMLKKYVSNRYVYDDNVRVELEGNQTANKWSYYNIQTPWIYNSIIPNVIGKAMLEYGNCDFKNVNQINGLNERAELDAIFNIERYYDGGKNEVPYGYVKKASDYVNVYNVPFGYTYDEVISKDKISELNGVEKSFLSLDYGISDKDFEIENINVNNKVLNDDFEIKVENNKCCFAFAAKKNVQLYLKVDVSDGSGCSGKIYHGSKYINYFQHWPDTVPWHINKDEVIINLGYYDEVSNFEIETFGELGQTPIKLNDREVELYSIDMSGFADSVRNLADNHMENVVFKNNSVTGDLSVTNDKYLCLSVPYIDGYTGYIDGNKTDLFEMNYLFVGMKVPKGNHVIEIKYESPGLKIGMVISSITILVIVIIGLYKCLRKRDNNERKS
ncbi:YfhO family protein [Eubacterium sp.]|uniref:YfhO family protein n=1 Tax=Eubacterium sp. TaxID=142586 RepID=UPI0025D84810|nr:YfhO family protein [Eubacterium sp.]MCR5628082.1 YfhO family protein [Eubacterium sp.]